MTSTSHQNFLEVELNKDIWSSSIKLNKDMSSKFPLDYMYQYRHLVSRTVLTSGKVSRSNCKPLAQVWKLFSTVSCPASALQPQIVVQSIASEFPEVAQSTTLLIRLTLLPWPTNQPDDLFVLLVRPKHLPFPSASRLRQRSASFALHFNLAPFFFSCKSNIWSSCWQKTAPDITNS